MSFAAAYGCLVLVQAGLVATPGRPRRLRSSRVLGLVVPASAMVVGVALARAHGGGHFLATLAAVATPLLAAGSGWARGWRLPLVPALAVPPLYAVAWLAEGTPAGAVAGVVLIAGACLAVTGLVAAFAPPRWLAVGLIVLVAVDVLLVWGTRQVAPTMNALAAAQPPSLTHGGNPLPSLQQIDLGSATMGWLDFAAPALLGLIVASRARAAVATGVAAAGWGLLLFVTSPIAATPPILAGLLTGLRRGVDRPRACRRASASAASLAIGRPSRHSLRKAAYRISR